MEEKRMHVRIVPMNADHLDEVAELERICFSVPWSRNMLAEELDNLLSAFLVALDDNDKVVGYAGVQIILDEGYITNVAVRPECRRQGIAAGLTSRLAVEILNRGKVPFYCAAWCNVKSVRNAIKSGFRPAWVEMTAKPCETVDGMNQK